MGPAGENGTNGLNGTPGLTWQGAWSPATSYAVNDAVSYGGASYLSVAAGNVAQAAGSVSAGVGGAGAGRRGRSCRGYRSYWPCGGCRTAGSHGCDGG